MVIPAPLPLVADGVSFTYRGADRAAITGISFELGTGRVLLVVGPSGSGKSTLARSIAGLVPRDIPGTWSGSLLVGDLDVSTSDRGRLASAVGLLFQDPGSQLVMDRVADDVAFGLENRAWALDTMQAAVPAALDAVGLGGFERRRGTRLSGGEQQRLALAGVLAAGPGMLVLDEPTANLDPAGASALFERLSAAKRSGAITVVLVEHRADLAWPLADMVLALDGAGSPIAFGPPGEVIAKFGEVLVQAGIWVPDPAPMLSRGARNGSTGSDAAASGRVAGGAATGELAPGEAATGEAVGDADEGPPPDPRSAPDPAQDPLVQVSDLRFAYEPGVPVVRDIGLTIDIGERIALLGQNGSGKSTLLRLIAGLLGPSSGSVRVAGHDPARVPAGVLAEMVGFVFQDPELGFLADTVSAEMALGLAPMALPGAAVLMDRLRLPLQQFGDRSPYSLSGGEQRRLSVAAALAHRPRLLVLDEPTFGQDRHGWEAIAAFIDELVDVGTTVIVATHDEAFAARIASRRIEMADGWIVADEPMKRPRSWASMPQGDVSRQSARPPRLSAPA